MRLVIVLEKKLIVLNDLLKVLWIAKKICALRKRFMHREKDFCIAKKTCRLRKQFVHLKNDLCVPKKTCQLRKRFFNREKDLCIAKKICQLRKRFVDREKDLLIGFYPISAFCAYGLLYATALSQYLHS